MNQYENKAYVGTPGICTECGKHKHYVGDPISIVDAHKWLCTCGTACTKCGHKETPNEPK